MSELLDKVKALEKFHNHKPDKIKSNREKYPQIAEFVDRLREIFGEVRVVKVTGGQKLTQALPPTKARPVVETSPVSPRLSRLTARSL